MENRQISWYVCLLAISFLICLGFPQQIILAKNIHPRQAFEVIDQVNGLRLSNGLSPYQVNSALMAAAQAHSEYQASIGTATHSGAGGSRPLDRAIAAGYGGGAQVYISENIYAGHNVSASEAVNWWATADALHRETLLSGKYQDAGAGVAVVGDFYYYTLDVGFIAGSVPNPQPILTPFRTTSPLPKPIIVATANPDGSIVHIVEQGQTLWTIAAIYNVPLQDLLKLNNLSEDSFVFPGNKILIQPPYTETPPVNATLETPTATHPNPTETATATFVATETLTDINNLMPEKTSETQVMPAKRLDPWRGILAITIAIIATIVVVFLSLGKDSDITS